jgi:hypothetical protein
MIVLVQGASLLFVPQRVVRWTLVVAGAVAIGTMFLYVLTLPGEDEGAHNAALSAVRAGLGGDHRCCVVA